MNLEYTKQQLNAVFQASIKIPYHLRSITNDQAKINVTINNDINTIKDVLQELFKKYPRLSTSILDEEGNIAKVISLYVNDKNVKKLDNLNTELAPGNNEISFRPAIAGG